jgi:hypothetical protein
MNTFKPWCRGNASPVSETGNQWKLVWCYERCYKDENRSHFKNIRDAIEPMGGKLVAVKKAAQVTAWIQRNQAVPYILITVWREAQPLMKSLQSESNVHQPSFSLVLCSNPRQVRRSTKWAQSLPSKVGPVWTCMQDQIPPSLLNGVLQMYFSATLDSENVRPMSKLDPCEHDHELLAPSWSTDVGGIEGEDTREPSEADLSNDGLCHEVRSEETFEEQFRDLCLQEVPDDSFMPVPISTEAPEFLVSLPPPVSLVRDHNAVLTIGECKGSLSLFSLEPWALEVSS